MPVGLLTLELHIADARSLKDKRQILRSLKDRLRRKFNIAIAEIDFHDVWQSSTVGIVTLSNAEQHVEESLQHVLAEAQRILGPVLTDHSVDLLWRPPLGGHRLWCSRPHLLTGFHAFLYFCTLYGFSFAAACASRRD